MKQLTLYLTILIISTQLFGGTKTISIDFELSETAINRAIVSQFNEPNYPFKHFTGQFTLNGVPNVSYSVKLARPTVVIENNSIGINMAFTFEASIGSVPYNYSFNITPSISINNGSISGSNVVAYLDNLDDEINATDMEWEIKVLLIGLYNVFKPQIYARDLFNEVLDEINSNEFIAQRAFRVTDFGIGYSFNAGKFVVKAEVEITYGSTYFKSQITVYGNNGNEYIYFRSNIQCVVESILIYDPFTPMVLYDNSNLNIVLTKSPSGNYYSANFEITDISDGFPKLAWEILYKTDVTFYFNKYLQNIGVLVLPTNKMNN